ncbi:MAG: hypothetical protein DCC73_11605 [Proteobacteria bacterium]|nr:MAG: hypothetical protein DCC73_11605 [Pseudomonadota bacterium]
MKITRLHIPYLVAKAGRNGATRYFWQPGPTLRKQGYRGVRLSDDFNLARKEADHLTSQVKSKTKNKRKNDRPQGIYIFTAKHHIKVGISNHPIRRLSAVQSHNSADVALAFFWLPLHCSAPALELEIHAKLGRLHLRGEWFKADAIEVAKTIIELDAKQGTKKE